MTARGLTIIGLGMALPPHAAALAELGERFRVVGAWSRSADRRGEAAARFGLPVTDDLDALIADPAVEAALILTPPTSHTEIGLRFLEAGKHVLVEKPLDTDLARAERLVATARERDRRLGVVLQHRFRPAGRALAERLAAGTLGEIQAATCDIPWWRDQPYYDVPGRGTRARDGGGVLMTQAIHTLDLFRALTGGVRRVAALAATTALHAMECEDVVTAAMELVNGAPASLAATTAAYPGGDETIRLVCARGVATIRGNALTIDHLDGGREELGGGEGTGGGADPMAFSHEPHRDLIADFADAIDAGRAPRVNGEDGLATQRLIETLLESARLGAWCDVAGTA